MLSSFEGQTVVNFIRYDDQVVFFRDLSNLDQFLFVEYLSDGVVRGVDPDLLCFGSDRSP